MKAVDYMAKYGEVIFQEATRGKTTSILDLFDEMYSEIETICKTRNARSDSAKISAVKEINQKWNKLRDLFIKTYTASPLKKDAIQTTFLKANPKAEGLFVIDKTIRKFEPEQAQKEFDGMSDTSRFLVTMAMLGAMSRGETEIN